MRTFVFLVRYTNAVKKRQKLLGMLLIRSYPIISGVESPSRVEFTNTSKTYALS